MFTPSGSYSNWYLGEGFGAEKYIELNAYKGGLWNNIADPFVSGVWGYIVQYEK